MLTFIMGFMVKQICFDTVVMLRLHLVVLLFDGEPIVRQDARHVWGCFTSSHILINNLIYVIFHPVSGKNLYNNEHVAIKLVSTYHFLTNYY